MQTLVDTVPFLNGIQKLYKFSNGYGASVVCHDGSYGGPYRKDKENLWEIAVLDSDNSITYHTPITQDVVGHCDDEKVEEILKEISELVPVQEVQLELEFGQAHQSQCDEGVI